MRSLLMLFVCVQIALFAAEWKRDYQEALVESKKSEKPLLLAFMGAGWCPWSEKIELEALAQARFLDEMDAFLLVKVELPQHAGGSGESLDLKEQYAIEEYPTFVLVDSSEEEITKLGYMPLAASELAAYFNEILAAYREIEGSDLAHSSAEALQVLYFKSLKYGFNAKRHELLAVGLKKDSSPFFLLEKYKLLVESGRIKGADASAVRKELVRRDPHNAFGVHRTLAIVDFHRLSTRGPLRKKPEQIAQPLLDYVKEFGSRDQEHLWKVEMMIAQFFFSRGRVREAIVHAEASLKAAPEEAQEEIRQSISFLKTHGE